MTEHRVKLRGEGRSSVTVEPFARNIVIHGSKSILLQCNKSNCGLIFSGLERGDGQAAAGGPHSRIELFRAPLCGADPRAMAIRARAAARPHARRQHGCHREVHPRRRAPPLSPPPPLHHHLHPLPPPPPPPPPP